MVEIPPRMVVVVSFELQNSAVPQPSPTVSVSAMIAAGAYGAPVSPTPLTLLNQTVFGVALGGNPLFAMLPAFVRRDIGQNNPLASASTTITVTLQTNCDFTEGSLVFLTNLTGSQTADDSALPVESVLGGGFEPTGVWKSGPGSMELVVGSQGLLHNESYVLSFVLRNSATSQLSPSGSLFSRHFDDEDHVGRGVARRGRFSLDHSWACSEWKRLCFCCDPSLSEHGCHCLPYIQFNCAAIRKYNS